MISTQNPNQLTAFENLRMLCKAISVLDAMICPDWEFRYYSYNAPMACQH